MIANSNNRGLDIGLNPAWRDAVTHFIVAEGWLDNASPAVIQSVRDDITYNKTYALRQLAPDSGAYFNEVGGHSHRKDQKSNTSSRWTRSSLNGSGPSLGPITSG